MSDHRVRSFDKYRFCCNCGEPQKDVFVRPCTVCGGTSFQSMPKTLEDLTPKDKALLKKAKIDPER